MNGFQHFCQTLKFYNGFTGKRLGQNVRIDRRIMLGFHQKSDFDPCFAGQSPCFPVSFSLFRQYISLWRADMGGAYLFGI